MADFTFKITVPDEKATDILNSVTDRLGYDLTKGITRQEFLRQEIAKKLKDIYREAKKEDVMRTAVETASNDALSIDFL